MRMTNKELIDKVRALWVKWGGMPMFVEELDKIEEALPPEAVCTTVEFCGKPAAAHCAIAEQCQYGKDRDNIIEACAQIAERTYPRGEAHTYASENADRYIALEDACEVAAERIRALKQSKPQVCEGDKNAG